jgi:hypothetical protein
MTTARRRAAIRAADVVGYSRLIGRGRDGYLLPCAAVSKRISLN